MTKLSDDARDLIHAARAGEEPPARARSRVRARVLAKVGAGAVVGSATMLGASSSAAKAVVSTGLLVKLTVAATVLSAVAIVTVKSGVLGSVTTASPVAHTAVSVTAAPSLTLANRGEVPPAPIATPTAAPSSEAVTAAPTSVPSVATAPSARAPAPRPSAARGADLDTEMAILQRAQDEVRAGHPDRAVALFDEHQGAFEGGALQEEQRASRILALCAAGRTAEAKTEAQRFLAESPRSPMAARVRSSCAGSATP